MYSFSRRNVVATERGRTTPTHEQPEASERWRRFARVPDICRLIYGACGALCHAAAACENVNSPSQTKAEAAGPFTNFNRPMQAPRTATDADLMEALGYFTEEAPVNVASSPVNVDAVAAAPTKALAVDGVDVSVDVDSMLLSLEIQELLSSSDEGEQVAPTRKQEVQSPPKKIDGRLRPYSTCKRRNRRRPKHELEYLRSKVAELQEELEMLSKSDVADALRSAAGVEEPQTQRTALVPRGFSSWKDIADCQRREADNSIDENRRLRNRLLGQLQVARVLEAAIAQHQKDVNPWHGMRTIGSGVSPPKTPLSDAEIFDQLNASVETQLAQVNEVLTTSGLSNVFHDLAGGFDFKREVNGISFRHEEARLLPFTLQAWHDALWNSLHYGLVVKDTTAQALTKDHSNLIFRDMLELPKSHQVSVTKRAAFRRHIEQDRVIFVWSSYVEIDGSVSVRLREKGWSTASTFEFYRGVRQGAHSPSSFRQGCMTRMAVQVVPEVSEFNSQQEAQMHVGDVTDLIVGTYRHNFGLVHEVVEKVLLTTAGEGSSCEVVRM
ncbi:ABC transporter G family member 29 [Phytophthora cinnamomi]|uniref:ABC transporter G family member 29 n=1 Tax=Phytophthora cinnamomi TaxID=4785 RepID=UPI00355A9263|nr:ABC transporter G family member 29 [Phytophthora cinnamomi]